MQKQEWEWDWYSKLQTCGSGRPQWCQRTLHII